MIKAVIFDLGGTLIEYAGEYHLWPDMETPGLRAAHNHLTAQGTAVPAFDAFRDAGFALLPKRWRQATAGEQNLRLADLIGEILAANGYAEGKTAVIAAAAQAYEAAIQAQCRPIEGGKALLEQLQESGYRLGLISNTMFRGEAHLEDLARFGLDGYFHATLFSADENKWKPNRAPFDHILEELKVEPGAAVYVGDDPANDVVGSQRAGLKAVHIRSSERFAIPAGARADATIDRLADLPQTLTGWR
jgi:HAD superfamily hydrolase (TIGR01549 family)